MISTPTGGPKPSTKMLNPTSSSSSSKTYSSCRLIILGQSQVGKTSLIKRLINSNFDQSYEETFVTTYYLHSWIIDNDKDICSVQLVEIPYALHEHNQILNELSINDYLIFVYDVTNYSSFLAIQKIHKTYHQKQFLKRKNIILLGNKMDKIFSRKVKSEEGENLAKKLNASFKEITCKEKYNPLELITLLGIQLISYKNNLFISPEKKDDNITEQMNDFDYEYKISLFGPSGVGKSNIIDTFINGKFNEGIKTTNQISYSTKIIKIENKKIRLNIWDSIGKPQLKTLNKALFKDNLGCIFVYDINNKSHFEQLKELTDFYKEQWKYDTILLLGNKADLANDCCQISMKEGKELADKLNANFFWVSAKNNINIHQVFEDICIDIHNKENPNEKIKKKSKEKLIQYCQIPFDDYLDEAINIVDEIKNKKEIAAEDKRIIKTIKEYLKKNLETNMRCSFCNNLLNLTIHEPLNFIKSECKKCINYKSQMQKSIEYNPVFNMKCYDCNEIDVKNGDKLNYCFCCAKLICKKCEKNHLKAMNTKKENLINYYLMDILCNKHQNQMNKFYCTTCKEYICIECLKEIHRIHNIRYFNINEINEIINKKKQKLEHERNINNYIKVKFNECIENLKQKFEQLMNIKEKEFKIKETLVNNLEVIKHNYTNIENISKLNFDNSQNFKFDDTKNWDEKIKIIFNYLNTNQLKQFKQINEKISFNDNLLILDKNKNQNIFNKSNNNYYYNNSYIYDSDNYEITDICSINSNYLGVSYDNGALKIFYKNLEKFKYPIKTIREFSFNQGIFSIFKEKENVIYCTGYEKIKKIVFSFEKNNNLKYKSYDIVSKNNLYFLKMIKLSQIKGAIVLDRNHQLLLMSEISGGGGSNNTSDYMVDLGKKINVGQEEIVVSLDELNEDRFIVKIIKIKKFVFNQNNNNISEKDESDFENLDNLDYDFDNKNFEKNFNYLIIQLSQEKENDNKSNKDNKNNKNSNSSNNNILINTSNNNSNNSNNGLIINNDIINISQTSVKSSYTFIENIIVLGKLNQNYLVTTDTNETNSISLFNYNDYEFIGKYTINLKAPTYFNKFQDINKNYNNFIIVDADLNIIQYIFANDTQTMDYIIEIKNGITYKNKNLIKIIGLNDSVLMFNQEGNIYSIKLDK